MPIATIVTVLDTLTRVGMRFGSLGGKRRVARVNFGLRIACDTRDFIQRRLYYFGVFEHNLSAYIPLRLEDGDVFVDVGANIGYFSLVARRCVGDQGRVVAIEASPATFEQLCGNIALNGFQNIHAIHAAATGGPCEVRVVCVDPQNIGANRIEAGSGGAVRGDSLGALLGADREVVDVIKIDIEGSEGPVLEDLIRNIAFYPRLRAIAVELRPENAHLFAQLGALGFRGYGMPNDYTIGYYIIRRYLASRGEGALTMKVPLNAYDCQFTDFVFERAVTLTTS